MPADLLNEPATYEVSVRAGEKSSRSLPFRVLNAELPPPPTLDSIEPSQVSAGEGAQWITLTGTRFVTDDVAVKMDVAVGELSIEIISATEMRAMVPSGFLQNAGEIGIRVQSVVDPELASETRIFTVVGNSGTPTLRPPDLTAIEPRLVPYLEPGASAGRTIEVQGSGFLPESVVYAQVDDAPPQPLATSLISADTLRAELPKELWSERILRAEVQVQSNSGTITATQFISRFTPEIDLTQDDVLTYVDPSLFYDVQRQRYLLNTGSTGGAGTANGDTFDKNPKGFQIRVNDPSNPNFGDPSKASIRLGSRSGGSEIDSIDIVNMKQVAAKRRGSAQMFESRARQIVAVTDGVDDGRVQAKVDGQNQRFGPGRDGDRDDPTILARLGGELEVTYRKSGSADIVAKVAVGHPTTMRTVHVRARVIGNSGWDVAQLQRWLTPSSPASVEGPTAADLWASVGVRLELADAIQVIPPPTPTSITPEAFRCFGPPRRCVLTQDYRDIIATRENPSQDNADGVITLFFVESFRVRNAAQALVATSMTGQAVPDIGFFVTQQSTQVEPPEVLGVAFIARTSDGPMANAKTVSHELAHVALAALPTSADVTPQPSDLVPLADDAPEILNLLYGGPVDVLTLTKKRFNRDQIEVIRRGNKYLKP